MLCKFWVRKYKLGIRYLNGVHVGYNIAHHKNVKNSNKRRK
jgi:hypothetical protein